jgi:hypothetical protein
MTSPSAWEEPSNPIPENITRNPTTNVENKMMELGNNLIVDGDQIYDEWSQ